MEDIRRLVSAMKSSHQAWAELSRVERLLAEVGNIDWSDRTRPPGHITASAVVVDTASFGVAMIRHRKLNRWLIPGGHVDRNDATLRAAATREASEELGLPPSSFSLSPLIWRRGPMAGFPYDYGLPLDIDVHVIPLNPKSGELPHLHYDFRWLMFANLAYVTRNEAETADYVTVRPDDDWLPPRVKAALADLAIGLDGLGTKRPTSTASAVPARPRRRFSAWLSSRGTSGANPAPVTKEPF